MIPLGKTLMGATAATALAVAAPAQARDHDDGIDGGDILAGALILGGVAAVIAAVSDDDDNDRYERDVRYDPRYGRDGRYEPRYDGPYARNQRGHYRPQRLNPRVAVNQCATAAQRRASQYGRARITEITDVDRKRNGYDVEGRLVVNEARWHDRWNRGRRWNANYGNNLDRGRFTCRIRYGQVERVRIRGID
jgi:hypothetical protein